MTKTCPNCGAQFDTSQLLEVECPYCGGKFTNPLLSEKPVPDDYPSTFPQFVFRHSQTFFASFCWRLPVRPTRKYTARPQEMRQSEESRKA